MVTDDTLNAEGKPKATDNSDDDDKKKRVVTKITLRE